MKVLSIIDSFKGTLTSIELSQMIKERFNNEGIDVKMVAISDGGDGLLDSFLLNDCNCNFKKNYLEVFDPLFRKINSFYLIDNKKTAIIELAKASGIGLLNVTELDPLITSTYGTGQMIKNAILNGCQKIVVGIGGSATNDGGSGMLEALGVKFFHNNELIERINNLKLKDITRIDLSEFLEFIGNVNFVILSDVTNPLLGYNGATYVYSSQKGAKDLEVLESNMYHWASFNPRYTDSIGSGAAGGVGYAFYSYFKSVFYSGIDYILDMIDYNNVIKDMDVIISGEGKIDNQSLSGKVISQIINRSNNKRIILLCAINEIDINFDKNIKIYSIVNSIASKEESLNDPQGCFKKLIEGIKL